MRCLSCAGAPRPPASSSGLSLSIPSWHATPYDPGEFDDGKFQSSNVDGAFGAKSTSRHSQVSRNPFHAGHQFRGFHGSPICCGLPGCLAPCTDLTGYPANGAFYFQAFNEIGPLLGMTTAVAGPLRWWDSHPLERQLDSLHDFADAKGTIASQHYAFHVSDAEFDAILQRV